MAKMLFDFMNFALLKISGIILLYVKNLSNVVLENIFLVIY